jgi:hypothetical protein
MCPKPRAQARDRGGAQRQENRFSHLHSL